MKEAREGSLYTELELIPSWYIHKFYPTLAIFLGKSCTRGRRGNAVHSMWSTNLWDKATRQDNTRNSVRAAIKFWVTCTLVLHTHRKLISLWLQGPKSVNFFRQASSGNWIFFFSRHMQKFGCRKVSIKWFLHSEPQTLVANFSFKNQNEEKAFGASMVIFPLTTNIKSVSIKHGLRTGYKTQTKQYGLGVKYGLGYKTRTEHYGLSIKHKERSTLNKFSHERFYKWKLLISRRSQFHHTQSIAEKEKEYTESH